jgi:ABC-type glycerol-3-phosphate transport system substrate-binding protein
MFSRKVLLPLVLSLAVAVGLVTPLRGQGEVIITLLAPEWMGDVFNRSLFEEFEAQNPGVKVVVAQAEQIFYPPAAFDLDGHLDGAAEFASKADVLYTQSYNLSPITTRAGYFLDLTPLVESDPTLDVDDFFPALWRSFQWDRGIWALPVSGSIQLFVYDIDAFDDAGLTYPNENWTIHDLANAARTLTQHDTDGDVARPGFGIFFNRSMLLRAFTGQGFYDGTVIPSPPAFDNTELAQIIENWAEMQRDLQSSFQGPGPISTGEIPLTVDQTWRLTSNVPDDRNWGAALLPGGVAGLTTWGFVISSGTEHPEIAYELAKFLTQNANVAARFFGDTPARRSLVGVETEGFMVMRNYTPEVQALIDRGIENALPTSELRYSEYIDRIIGMVESGETDAQSALQQMEAEARTALQTADTRRQETVVMVATPVPTPSFDSGQIVLNFGLNLFISPIPNRDEWNRLAREFSEASSIVGNVELVSSMGGMSGTQDEVDCYYQPQNMVQGMNLDDVLNFDPFMDADPQFDSGDFFGGTLEQVRRENRTWAYPIVLYPSILWYHAAKFQEAGVAAPESVWSVDAFNDALRNLRFVMDDDSPVFVAQGGGGMASHLYMLMAAYGGLPIDYRTSPPTLNLDDPATIDAMRQVLNLARDGYISYQELAGTGAGTVITSGLVMDQTPIFGDALMPYSFRAQQRGQEGGMESPYRLTNYPHGSEYVPVSYGIGTAYINADTQNAQACYEWIRTISQRPELLMGMPARRSQLESAAIATTQGEDIAQTYRAYADLVGSPNVISIPGQLGLGGAADLGTFIEQFWLYEAFDDYVLNGGDLETGLADATFYIQNYRDCAADIPSSDISLFTDSEEVMSIFRRYADCAISVDPRLAERFNFPD